MWGRENARRRLPRGCCSSKYIKLSSMSSSNSSPSKALRMFLRPSTALLVPLHLSPENPLPLCLFDHATFLCSSSHNAARAVGGDRSCFAKPRLLLHVPLHSPANTNRSPLILVSEHSKSRKRDRHTFLEWLEVPELRLFHLLWPSWPATTTFALLDHPRRPTATTTAKPR